MLKLKLLVAVLITFSVFSVSAQDTLKHTAGRKSLELKFIPFSPSNPILIDGIRYRGFGTSKFALRITTFLSVSSNAVVTQQQNVELKEIKLRDFSNVTTFSIKPGFESHLKGTRRLSPYLGGELDFGITASNKKSEQQRNESLETIKIKNQSGTESFFRLGANAIAGFDFYIAKDIYLGTEFGFGFSYVNYADTKTVHSDGVIEPEPKPIKNGFEFTLSPNVQGEIRLGFLL